MHRVILGSSADNLIVHHKDENKLNNKKSNLEILTRAEHARLHNPLEIKALKGGEE